MATDLTTIFGSDISVITQPRRAHRQFTGFSGAHGVTSMNLGTRGRMISVTGRLSATGANYNTARASLQSVIDAIEDYQTASAADYTYRGQSFYSVVFGRLRLLQGASGKSIHYTAAGRAVARFTCILREQY